MRSVPQHSDDRSKPFDWAEPLICEQVLQTYSDPSKQRRDLDGVVAVQTRMWLSLIDGDIGGFDAGRSELVRLAHQAQLTSAAIDRADRAVLLELILVVVTRFRNSDRVRLAYAERLQAALRVIKANPVLHAPLGSKHAPPGFKAGDATSCRRRRYFLPNRNCCGLASTEWMSLAISPTA